MVARTGGSVEAMLFFYNNSSNDSRVIPSSAVFKYDVMLPDNGSNSVNRQRGGGEVGSCPFSVGEQVYVQPPGSRCMTP